MAADYEIVWAPKKLIKGYKSFIPLSITNIAHSMQYAIPIVQLISTPMGWR